MKKLKFIREPKFRALIQYKGKEKMWIYYKPLTIPHAFLDNEYPNDRPKIIVKDLEYTRREDKLKRELFEGDIVRFSHYSERGSSGKMIGEIYWDYQESAWAIYSENNEIGMGTKNGLYLGWAKNIELLGNKYEHPEMQEEY